MNAADWHSFEYELKYRLGEITLGRHRFNVLRKVYSLHDILSFADEPVLPDLNPGLDGYLLANIPRECVSGSIEQVDGLLRYCLKSYMRCHIDMTTDFDAYRRKFSGKTRSSINRKVRKFAENAGSLDFRCYRTPVEISEFFKLARPVSATSYQERLLDYGLPDTPDFIEHAQAAAAHDNVRAFLLFSEGRAVSYLYCPVNQDVLEYAFLGFVPEFSKQSPGTVLQWLALEKLFSEDRFAAFDFTEGDSEHKRFFSTHQTPCSLQLLLLSEIRTRLSIGLHRSVDSTSKTIGNGLDRLGLKRKIKQWLRQSA